MSDRSYADALKCHVERMRCTAMHSHGVPAVLAQHAADATLRAFHARQGEGRLETRVRSYFWAVVRRKSMREPGAAETRARFTMSAVVADLKSCGRGSREVWSELERGWADKIPATVLEEYRKRLCA